MELVELKNTLVDEVKQEITPLVEEVRRSTEAIKLATNTLTNLQAASELYGFLLYEILVYQLMFNVDPLQKAQKYRANVIALIQKNSDLTKPVDEAILNLANNFLDGLVATFEKAADKRPDEDWPSFVM